MRFISALSALAACAFAQLVAAQMPEPPPAAGYDRLEQYLWEGAARQNTPDGYRVYLERYPQGLHAEMAREQLDRFAGRAPAPQPTPYQRQVTPGYSPEAVSPPLAPQIEAAPPPAPEPTLPSAPTAGMAAPPAFAPPLPAAPMPAPIVAAAAKGSPLFLCRPVFAGGTPPFEQAGEAELASYFQALKINSLGAYEAYLKAFPNGVFSAAVSELVATREGRARAFAATNVPGPMQAHPRTPVAITVADYQQGVAVGGSTTAVWEVAEDGCVQYCRIEKSSGSAAFDAATCRAASARGAYDPARDSAGKPIRSIETGTFNWATPAK